MSTSSTSTSRAYYAEAFQHISVEGWVNIVDGAQRMGWPHPQRLHKRLRAGLIGLADLRRAHTAVMIRLSALMAQPRTWNGKTRQWDGPTQYERQVVADNLIPFYREGWFTVSETVTVSGLTRTGVQHWILAGALRPAEVRYYGHVRRPGYLISTSAAILLDRAAARGFDLRAFINAREPEPTTAPELSR